MHRVRSSILIIALLVTPTAALAAKKVLFDNAHAETAGNADWEIDTHQPLPSPDQSGIGPNTPGTYWVGAISSFGVDMVKRGYVVHTNTGTITYGNGSNPYDLSNYDLFVVPEPNTLFSSAEATAILNFVHDGGGLIAISDHSGSDRNNDGSDSPMIWDALDPTHLLGVHFGVSTDANNNIVQTSTNVAPSASDSVTHGPVGAVTGLAFHNGTTLTLYPSVNPTVRGEVWMTGVAQTSTSSIMAAASQYGSGRVFFIGDSSPVDDGSAAPGNSSIFDGWGEAGATDSTLFLNAALWASRRATTDTQPPAVTITSPNGGEDWKAGATHAITWNATDNVGVTTVDLAYSTDGGATFPNGIASGPNTGSFNWLVPNAPGNDVRVQVTAHDAAGNTGSSSSAANFTIDEWSIPAAAGAGGVIVPAGAVPVVEGASQHFSIAPANGFAVSSLTVDGGSVPPDTAYTFVDVVANHSISVTFADVQAPSVQLTAPIGGERWDEGSTETITWTASDNAAVDSMNVDLSLDGPSGPWSAIAHGLANTGTYSWTLPPSASDQAVVRVTAFDHALNSASASSDSAFHIADPVAGVSESGPKVLALAHPEPNPGRGSVALRFSLPDAGRARVQILDLDGRRVWERAGSFAARSHVFTWDGRIDTGGHAGAGLYFVRLVTDWGNRTERLVWLR